MSTPAKKKKKEEVTIFDIIGNSPSKEEERYIFGEEDKTKFFSSPNFYFPTGIKVLDAILGNGGLGSGRLSEVFGPERSGKSELARIVLTQFLMQHENGFAFYYDQEQALGDKAAASFNDIIAQANGRIVVRYFKTAEALLQNMCETLEAIHEKCPEYPGIIILDSVAALAAVAEADGDIGDAHMALIPRLLGPALRKIRPLLQLTNTHLLLINQLRSGMNQGGRGGGQQEDESPGGKALKYWCDYRIRTYTASNKYEIVVRDKDDKVPTDGVVIRYKTIKNKLAIPLRECTVPLLFGSFYGQPSGLSDIWSVFDLLKFEEKLWAKGGRYHLEWHVSPDQNALAKDKYIPFTKGEWALIYVQHEKEIDAYLKEWSDKQLLINAVKATVELESLD